MTLHRNAAALAAAIVALAVCQPAAAGTDEMDAVKAVNAAWADHYNAGDAEALTNLYWDDAVVMPPGVPASKGREAILAYFKGDIEAVKSAGLTMSTDHGPVSVSGTLAWQDGAFRATDASGAIVDAGKYLSVLEKRDGQWRLLRDTWNSDGAAPAAAAAAPDAVTADPAHYKVEFENDKVRVLRIAYGPKEKSVMHSHAEGVVVFLTDLDVRFTLPDGTSEERQVKAGTVGWSDAMTHEPENLGDKPLEVIQIEVK